MRHQDLEGLCVSDYLTDLSQVTGAEVDGIDYQLFQGKEFLDENARAAMRYYIDRWTLKLDELDRNLQQ